MNNSPIPIVVIHTGGGAYLETCLQQAAKASSDSPVVLIGNKQNANYPCTEFYDVDDPVLADDIAQFRHCYVNWADPLGEYFERFCIERWLLLRNLCRHKNRDRCLHIDSDVLLFCSAEQEAQANRKYAMTFARWDAARNLVHCNFIQNRDALASFCQYVLDVYQNDEEIGILNKFSQKKNGRYWISDMSLFAQWSVRTPFPFLFFEDLYPQGVYYDPRIDYLESFRGICYILGVFRGYKKNDSDSADIVIICEDDNEPATIFSILAVYAANHSSTGELLRLGQNRQIISFPYEALCDDYCLSACVKRYFYTWIHITTPQGAYRILARIKNNCVPWGLALFHGRLEIRKSSLIPGGYSLDDASVQRTLGNRRLKTRLWNLSGGRLRL